MMIKNKIIFLCAFLICGVPTFTFADSQQNFKEANNNFTYQNKPIHPGLVQQFMSWISDPGEPTTISVDIAAEHSNQYSDSEVEIKGKNICTKPNKEGAYFCYEHLGKLANGVHVLGVSDSGGGSGVFGTLVFVRFEIGDGINTDGNKYNRLLMTVVREYPLGDRDNREIKILSDKVVIGTERSTILSF